ncbi:uncharacterized protein [Arachis hypogaea]|uniref:uncharacterized protein n=1 Tax=Arachis hypogaea TaxID=3818 RepID=UPI000DEC9DCB
MATIQSDILSAFCKASSTFRSVPRSIVFCRLISSPHRPSFRLRAFTNGGGGESSSPAAVKLPEKPSICTADELHYVSVSNSDWRLALWRYHPSPQAPRRNHPLLLLSELALTPLDMTFLLGHHLHATCLVRVLKPGSLNYEELV